MLQFSLKDLFLLTAWIAFCASVFAVGNLNTAGALVVLAGVILSVLALFTGRLSKALILLASLSIALYAFDRLASVGVGDGHVMIALEVAIVEPGSMKPVPDATVEIHDLAVEGEGMVAGSAIVGRSGSDGKVVLKEECRIAVKQTPFTCRTYLSCSQWHHLLVARKGYQSVDLPITSKIGDGVPASRKLSLVVQLHKVEEPGS